MIDQCMNPECKSKSKPLTDGNLYSLERRSRNTEFFWLCGECSQSLLPSVDVNGEVSVAHRTLRRRRTPPNLDRDLRTVAQFGESAPWHHYRGAHHRTARAKGLAGGEDRAA